MRSREPTSGSSHGAPVPDDDVMETRDAIRNTLVGLCRTIAYERGVTLPDDDVTELWWDLYQLVLVQIQVLQVA